MARTILDEDDGKAGWSVGLRVQVSRGFLPKAGNADSLALLVLWEVAEGLWWLVACCCESPYLAITLKGPLELLGGNTASQRGLVRGSTGLPALPTHVAMARESDWSDMTLTFCR